MSVLVLDVGTSSVRAAIVHPDATLHHEHAARSLPDSPAPGLVEFDAAAMADLVLSLAEQTLGAAGPVDAVGVTNQRGSVVVWDRETGTPVGPGIGWQDLRTIGRCLELKGAGYTLAPNHSATKIEALLDAGDPDRRRDLCAGTVDGWITWTLSRGSVHVIDATNASVTGLTRPDQSGWDEALVDALRIPEATLPAIVDSSGTIGQAHALAGAPPITALVGDQQASLAGQGCVAAGDAKITFGTGGMLDVVVGSERPDARHRAAGTYPLIARRRGGHDLWGVEAVMLAAGTNIEWLRDELRVVASSEETARVAAACEHTDGVWFVPAPLGLGTPYWDYGARGTLLGLTRGTGRPQLVRAVLEGIAHRGADMVDAAETDTGLRIERLRIDGGMSANPTFVQALADASQRSVEVSPALEATTLGAGFLAGLEIGTWNTDEDLAATWRPRTRVEPQRALDRDRWREAVARAERWIPDLSSISFHPDDR